MARTGGGPEHPERIGVFGGTFDPPHIGHLVVASHVRRLLALDRVLLVVANVPWQKVGTRTISPAAARLEMTEASVGDDDGIEASDVEIRRGGDSVTADTVDELLADDPDREVFVIVGADVEATLPTWRRVDDLLARATIVVVDRGGDGDLEPAVARPGERARVRVPRLDVSSSDLRARFADGRPVDHLVVPAVSEIVRHRRLYRVGG